MQDKWVLNLHIVWFKLYTHNFDKFEVVGRGIETQLQVGENLNL